jgi:hypothetical protein
MWVVKKQLFYKNIYDKNGKSIPVKDNNGNYVFTEESVVKITSFNTFCVNNYRIIEFLTTMCDEVFNVKRR